MVSVPVAAGQTRPVSSGCHSLASRFRSESGRGQTPTVFEVIALVLVIGYLTILRQYYTDWWGASRLSGVAPPEKQPQIYGVGRRRP